MKKWMAIAAGALIAYAIASSWPELVRYQRIREM
jgi:uncharacterized protein DUF6893